MTQTSRSTLMARIAPEIGGYAGSITSGTATTAVLGGLVGVLNDDELNDWLLVMPDATASGDQQRIVTDWTGSTGTATFAARVTDTTYTSETYFLVPKNTYTLQEIRDAISKSMRETKRTLRYVVPTMDDERQYPLTALSWLRNAKDVDGVQHRAAPGLLDNEDFSRWHSGTALAPDSWVLAGAAGTIAQSTSFVTRGPYSAQITRAGTDVTLSQTLPFQLAKQLIDARATVAIATGCRATAASRAYGYIYDGTTTTETSAHTGGSNYETLATSYTLTSAATQVTFGVKVKTGDTSAIFDVVRAQEGSAIDDTFTKAGSAGYSPDDVNYQLQNVGSGVPLLVPDRGYSRGAQFVVVSRRPFADFTSDADTTAAASDLIEARALYELALLQKPGQDRARPDRILAEYGPRFANLAAGQIDKPVQRDQRATWVIGA